MESQTLTLIGLAINALITLGGFIKFIVSFERRMTAVEIRLKYLAPKRHGDEENGQ